MARSFNGSTDKIQTVAVHNPAAATISAWCNPGTQVGAYSGIAGQNNGTTFFEILIKSTGKFAYFVSATASVTIDPGTATASGWTHVALVYDSVNGLKTFVNGVSDGTAAANGTAVDNNSTFSIGDDPGVGGRFLTGSLADIAWWNTNLTAGNITSLFNGVRPVNVNSANLIGWWPLDGFASPEPDLSTSGNNGTVTGTTQIIGPPALWRISG